MLFAPFPDKKKISQWFGENAAYYAKYGMKGHNGIDFAVPVGTPVYAPHEGFVTLKDNGKLGYGKHVVILSLEYKPNICRESTLAHLSKFAVQPGAFVSAGDLVGYSGNTGDSTGPHTHWTYCLEDAHGGILNYGNGFHGAIDLAPLVNGKRNPLFVFWPSSSFPS